MRNWFENDEYEYDMDFTLVNITRLAKYWVAKEMANSILNATQYFVTSEKSELCKILKKEWFR